ncbi:MAG: 3-oxoacyl-ACP reductase FabG [Clostridia bacterium]|nr:3-oxoacyl-ACP reductase FabG [Clostridia bacterium]
MKKVLITGGSRGIGRACVEYFSGLGYRVAFIYSKSDEAASTLAEACGALAIKADVSDPSSVGAAIERALEWLGGVDVLINNAGIAQVKLLSDVTDEDWSRMLGINLSGVFYTTRAVIPTMVMQKSGRIINIGSVWGRCGASCEAHYSATKSALRGLTYSLAKELGPSGVTVNCVEPGVIDTDMNGDLDEGEMRELAENTPLMRIGDPMEVAYVAEVLAAERASFITGQTIGVDRGFAL